ncbi:MAG: uncharacterized protein QOH84_2338 [Kribbellaceae bacterium]|nr:uncharacterized protein [Kribbellaceae bacterium]
MSDRWPQLGVGIGYRRGLHEQIEKSNDIDFLEVVAEQFLGRTAELRALTGRLPIIPHCTELSLLGTMRPDPEYLSALRLLCRIVEAPFVSDHFAVTRAPMIKVNHLCPPVLSDQALQTAAANISMIQDFLGVPLVLENITQLFSLAAEVDLSEYMNTLCGQTGCGLLLDLENVAVNRANATPAGTVEDLAAEHIAYLHVAGGESYEEIRLDSHSAGVSDEVWESMRLLSQRIDIKGVLIERDDNFRSGEDPLDDVRTARRILGGGAR